MRSAVNAIVSYGAFYVPVGVAPTASRNDVTFKTLHRNRSPEVLDEAGRVVTCHHPIKQSNRCPVCEVTLTADEQVKGFEIAKGQFVVVTAEELEATQAERTPLIQIGKFVGFDELEARMVEKSYFLIPPQAPLLKPYEILSAVLEDTGTAALGRASLWKKEYPVAVTAEQGVLYLLMLFCADEIRPEVEITSALKWDVTQEERDMARVFVDAMTEPIVMDDLISHSRQRVMQMIEDKAQGKLAEIAPAPPPPEPTIDYMAALRESVEMAQAARR